MLRSLRSSVIDHLWREYHKKNPQMQQIEHHLSSFRKPLPLDHFAIIDLPSLHTGIPILRDIFLLLGFEEHGKGYLPDKQNDFLWMADQDCVNMPASLAPPQAVVADFRLNEMPSTVRCIIEKYAALSNPFPMETAKELAVRINQDDSQASESLFHLITTYLRGRDWPLPSGDEFQTVKSFNELLAWVLVFGRQPNHFTVSVHLLDAFNNINDFHHFIINKTRLPLNEEGGNIKGGPESGIAQGSTIGLAKSVALSNGFVELPSGFVEFVWRYPHHPSIKPYYWRDYFTGFVARHANYVIESLY